MHKRIAAFVLLAVCSVDARAQHEESNTELQRMDGQHLTEYLKSNYSQDWILPAGKSHIVLAVPGSAEYDKSYVEPDGALSPGVASYGVTTWLYDLRARRLYAPEQMSDDQLSFHLEDGHIPIAHSSWSAGQLRLEKRIAVAPKSPESLESEDYVALRVTNTSSKDWAQFLLYVAVDSLGPAGGRVNTLSARGDRRTISLNGAPAVQFDRAPSAFGVTSFSAYGDDISVWAKRGELPHRHGTSDNLGLASGASVYRLNLAPGGEFKLYARCAIRSPDRHDSLIGEFSAVRAEQQLGEVRSWWRHTLEQMKITAPDPFGSNMYYASIAYILMNSVGNQLRVTNIAYPVSYLRDGVFMLDAIDQAGLHDRARDYLNYFLQHPWTGAQSQEGPEGDAPGELCWIIGEHYRLTHDEGWLRSVYPVLHQEADLILFMLHPMDRETREVGEVKLIARGNSVYATMDTELNGIPLHFQVELSESKDGIILGRLDTGLYAGTTSVFAIAGLKAAWEAAVSLGDSAHAKTYQAAYLSMRHAMNLWMKNHPKEFSFNAGVWPTEAFDPNYGFISDMTEQNSYAQLAANDYHGIEDIEPIHDFYIYFGAAHSLLRLGYQDAMDSNFLWPFLRSPFSQTTLGAYAYGEYTRDPAWFEVRHWPELWANIRGWTDLALCIPHGWTSAELASLIRDFLFYEDDGRLVLSAGKRIQTIPVGQTIGVHNGPTYYGQLTYSLKHESTKQYLLTFGGEVTAPRGILLELGKDIQVTNLRIDGRSIGSMPVGQILIPPGAEHVSFDVETDSTLSQPLAITIGPTVDNLSANMVSITWTTNRAASSRVAYGTSKPYHNVVSNYEPAVRHVVTLRDLKPGTDYKFQVSSREGATWQTVFSSDMKFEVSNLNESRAVSH